MIPQSISNADGDREKDEFVTVVQQLSVAEIESISIEDISSVQSDVLKDVLNDAVRQRLEQHLGGTYTSAPKMSIAELNEKEAAG